MMTTRKGIRVSALSEWDRAGSQQPLTELTNGQLSTLAELEAHMEGRRTLCEVK